MVPYLCVCHVKFFACSLCQRIVNPEDLDTGCTAKKTYLFRHLSELYLRVLEQ